MAKAKLIGMGVVPLYDEGKPDGFCQYIRIVCSGEGLQFHMQFQTKWNEQSLMEYRKREAWHIDYVISHYVECFEKFLKHPESRTIPFSDEVDNAEHLINVYRLKLPYLIRKACEREAFVQSFV
jgi:hypothetical protein